MIKIIMSIIGALAVSALIVGISSCEKKGTSAESIGRKIDQTVDKTDQKINTALYKADQKINTAVIKADQKIDTAVDETGKKIEKTGQKIQDSVKDSKK